MMKFSILFIILLYNITYSQTAFLSIKKIYSENKEYHVQIKGYFYEGFVGDQEISLVNIKQDTLWKQTVPRRFLIYPVVSNKGDVAITHREIKIYDKNNNLKGIYSFDNAESPYHVIDYMGTVHNFSVEGDRYYIFMFTGSPDNDIALYCLNDSTKIIWKSSVGDYRPHELLFYKNKLITNDCGTAGMRYTNYCYVFNESGEIIWKYSPLFKSRHWEVSLNSSKGILLIKDKATKIELKLDILDEL